ncbi:MAG TPA: hypothetical protein VFE54_09560 [Mucilaginibacter sp.]|nr:hypothetical protein [Mucilaginibacter sp.]
MEKFPILKNEHVVLLRAELSTGIVLDEQLFRATKDGQKVYTVFEEVDKSLQFAKQLISEHPNVECCIYSNEQKVLFYMTAEKTTEY